MALLDGSMRIQALKKKMLHLESTWSATLISCRGFEASPKIWHFVLSCTEVAAATAAFCSELKNAFQGDKHFLFKK